MAIVERPSTRFTTSHTVVEGLLAGVAVYITSGRVAGRFLLPPMLFVAAIGNSLTYFRIESRTFISDWSGDTPNARMGTYSAIKSSRPRTPFLIYFTLITHRDFHS